MSKKTFVAMLGMVLASIAGGLRAENIAKDTDFRTDNLGGVVNWSCIIPGRDRFEILDELGPDGGHAVRLTLAASGGFHQPGYKFVDSEPYRMSAWVRTKNLKPGNVSLIAYDDWLHINVKSQAFPEDTAGKWVKVEWCDKMFVNVKRAFCYFGVFAKKAMGSDETLDVAGLEIEPMSEKAKSGTLSPQPAQAFVPRIVPIMPKLADVDVDRPEMTFYYPGDIKGAGEIAARVDGAGAVKGALGPDRRVTLLLAGATEGRHRMKVVAVDDGKVVARNEYSITVRRRPKGGASGRKLNNFVTELPVERDARGVYFNAPEKAWYFMSSDRPKAERMQYLDPGRHQLPFPVMHDARVTVRKIRATRICGLCNTKEKTDLSRQCYGIDFVDRFFLPSMNTMSMWEWARKHHNAEMELFEERGIAQTYSISFNCGKKEWGDSAALAAVITNSPGLADGKLLVLDETNIQAPRRTHYAVAEALWSLADREDLHLGLFYNDAMRRGFSDAKTAPSVLAAIANCGGGTGLLEAEAYSAALPDLDMTREMGEAWYPKFQDSINKMAPCASGAVLYHVSGYIAPYLWCDYPAAVADYKVFLANLVRSFATNPAYENLGGFSYSSIFRVDEELARWAARVLRYYCIEGHTDDICEKYGFRYFPGHLRNGDFAHGLDGWTASPAEPGLIRMHNIFEFGEAELCFRETHKYNPRYGDDFVVMKRSASKPNVLSQKIVGLEKGRLYYLSCLTLKLADVEKPGSVDGRTAFRVDVEGCERIPGLSWAHEFSTGNAKANARRRKSSRHAGPCAGRAQDRMVFRAQSDTAEVRFSDWATADSPGGPIGEETILTYVICRPYYVESEAELAELSEKWGVKSDKKE